MWNDRDLHPPPGAPALEKNMTKDRVRLILGGATPPYRQGRLLGAEHRQCPHDWEEDYYGFRCRLCGAWGPLDMFGPDDDENTEDHPEPVDFDWEDEE